MSNYVETWKSIAHALGRSERWCRYMAQREGDPLPVFKVGGIVRLNMHDLEEWLGHQRTRTLARPVAEALGAIAAAADRSMMPALKLIA